ncbi:MAG: FecR domain-containing protein [Marinilabiliaceae bacterium]|nr:FecR domain-containing protein [Marinilabiliaceae bacterium]
MKLNIDKKQQDNEFDEFFHQHTVKFQVSNDKEWARLQNSIKEPLMWKSVVFRYAASFLIFVSSVLFVGLYSTSVTCPKGQRMAYTLPDGSNIQLNADTKISYHPIWWYLNRQVELDGEAFFKVKKGSQFTVFSSQGQTTVLGTSFNIFARNNNYRVTCISGKVAVNTIGIDYTLITGQSVKADIHTGKGNQESGGLIKHMPWLKHQLIFNRAPLEEVLASLERQYNISINSNLNQQHLYSGNLKLDNGIQDNLNAICTTFDLKYKLIDSSGIYSVHQ